ncbi:phenylalanine--tRNA ligase subunit beta [Malaciobacter mytili LMG 24559]|uniref:Phenylalanine--tRNA ligase beta subunit n=1 Tax=Malaciobacter mytili LMG 24559 TaxID=1032238 RepID=A0AAX2AFT5_9BACT|nr:phenylalanine--tRNA ligase subunit beta [Malaciobacter mytili]AXH13966.1 phenylalanyl-tRNA synthetase, beta subunit [Malaciobacter mytili LMG 24559]RXK15252.1 phenylalanine--tRNA ligase subunit beta [Malaciobacter mytili LMG 24559]
MIVTRRWLEEYIDISKISTKEICKTLNSIGLEVDSVEEIRIASGVVVGKVLEKVKHPDADKLNVCQVDIGKEVVQIVCGAKNVDAGQIVPVAVVGCKLGEDFKIKKAKLRGVESNGMICSSTEIGLPKLNDGILPLDESIGELVIGKELNEYKLLNDDIIEIELTANRGDCLSIHGIARELSAFYNLPIIEHEKNLDNNELGIGQFLEVECESSVDSSLIFKAIDFTDFKLPVLHKIRVGLIDEYKENDISDAISYSTHANGVILNAYASNKADKLNDLSVLHIKKDKDGFDKVYGKELLSTICVEHQKIDNEDTTYILEASYINPEKLSRKVFEAKKKTGEIYYRASRGSEPNIKHGVDCFTTFISKFGAKIYNGAEAFVEDIETIYLDINIDKINSIIGQETPKAEIENILNALGFEVKEGLNNVFSIQVPLYRHDIKNIADVTEEIVRIIGIDNIKAKPLAIDEVNRVNKTSNDLIKKNKIRSKAIENGFFETVTYVFTNKENLQKYKFPTVKEELDILNPIVNELNTFRTTILLNLVEACSNNFKQGFKSASFYEIGKVFDENRNETFKISFIFSGAKEQESFLNAGKPVNIDFFEFAKKILNSVGKFELEPMQTIENSFVHPYQNANILIDGKNAGFISKLHPSVANEFDLPDTFIAEIDFEAIKNDLIKAKTTSKFQASRKDLSVVVPKDMPYSKIRNVITLIEDANIKQFNLIDTYSDEKLGNNESLTIRFVLQNDEKTLDDEDITTTMNKILEKLNNELSIGLRD